MIARKKYLLLQSPPEHIKSSRKANIRIRLKNVILPTHANNLPWVREHSANNFQRQGASRGVSATAELLATESIYSTWRGTDLGF